MKKVISFVLALSMILGCFAFAFADDTKNVTVEYDNDITSSEWTWEVPSKITFTSTSAVNVQGSTPNVSVSHYIATSGMKLRITIVNNQVFRITNVTTGSDKTLDYTVSKTSGGAALAAGATVLEVETTAEAVENTGSQALYFTLGSTNARVAGKYSGTIQFLAAEVAESE